MNDFFIIGIDKITAEPVNWLVDGVLAIGELTMISGHPGVGKSLIASQLAAIVSNGKNLDGSDNEIGESGVLYLSYEEDPADSLKPRLIAQSANLSLVKVIDINSSNGFNAPIQTIRQILKKEREDSNGIFTKILILDPYLDFAGRIDSHKQEDARKAMIEYGKIAKDFGIAILMIAHLKKNNTDKPILNINGSIAMSAVPRVVFETIVEDDNIKLLLIKSNISQSMGTEFKRLSKEIIEPMNNKTLTAPYVTFIKNITESADDYYSNKATSKCDQAMDWLLEILQEDQLPSTEICPLAAKKGISKSTLDRAKQRLRSQNKIAYEMIDDKWFTKLV